MGLSKSLFAAKSAPAELASKQLGNMYTASLYGALASLIETKSSEELQGKRIGMYSYGSGLAATFFTIKVVGSAEEMRKNLKLNERIQKMEVRSCEEYLTALQVCLLSSFGFGFCL